MRNFTYYFNVVVRLPEEVENICEKNPSSLDVTDGWMDRWLVGRRWTTEEDVCVIEWSGFNIKLVLNPVKYSKKYILSIKYITCIDRDDDYATIGISSFDVHILSAIWIQVDTEDEERKIFSRFWYSLKSNETRRRHSLHYAQHPLVGLLWLVGWFVWKKGKQKFVQHK